MTIPKFTKYPSSLAPATFSDDMDTMIGEFPAFIAALNAHGSAFGLSVAGTSSSPVTVGGGVKELTVETAKGYVPGMDVIVASTADPNIRMIGVVISYSVVTGVLVVDVYAYNGSGDYSAWSVGLTAAVDENSVVTPDGAQTITNKTINLDENNVFALAADGSPTQVATEEYVDNSITSGRATFTADGDVGAGNVVVLNAGGTVSEVSSIISPGTLGAAEVQNAAATDYRDGIISIPGTNTVVAFYAGFLVAGEIDPLTDTMTWGTPVAVTGALGGSLVWHPVQERIALFYNNGTSSLAVAGSVSGTTITLGTPAVIFGNTYLSPRAVYNSHQNMFSFAYPSGTSTVIGRSATLVDTTFTFHAGVSIYSASNNIEGIVHVTGTPYWITIIGGVYHVIETNGTTITVRSGPFSGLASRVSPADNRNLVYDATTGKILAHGDSGAYQILTLTGTTLTVGPYATLPDPSLKVFGLDYNTVLGRIIILATEPTTYYLIGMTATIDGDTLVTSEKEYLHSTFTVNAVLGYNATAGKSVIAYSDDANLDYGTSKVWDHGVIATDADEWIGLAASAITDGNSGTVILKGGIATTSGLTPGYEYYIDDYGVLQQSGSRHAGVALSTTKLFLSGNM